MSEPRSTHPPGRTVLFARHEALGAVFTDFGGWQLPLRYGSELAEHRAVREAAGLFDVSHMAEFRVTGAGAVGLLDRVLGGRAGGMGEHLARYALVLADDGGIVDDVILYRTGADDYLVIANAGNRDAVGRALASVPSAPDADVEDVSDRMALVALQGPRAAQILSLVTGLAVEGALGELRSFRSARATFLDARVLIARTGYTGEDGFELLVPVTRAEDLWDGILAAGTPLGLVPAGLAARDTLRLEAGMPLYGHELTRAVRASQAGLAHVVGGDAAAADPHAPVLVGLVSDGRRAGRAGYAVRDLDGAVVGEVTSGALSPTLGHPIAMAYLEPASAAPGTRVGIDIRGVHLPATVTALPFYRRKK
ncbi:glycine cleavage system aminomethyltransferase GcvT [Microbacterium sp. SORGH_AS_0888]|uniref:glycine cleavage system aminomethyltransferase GcvT n=1 Tax=Microbacterium sp. SORGH_AS_0888 TaxID=3041791 RepID=UPI00278B039C|nr:glycine cleavage system aminomethyltransferase GcvT [Microbacterium sp. SORGH_AS_0888]MDQ1128163.1 aminomethyltransferase [Microbacterium sp. SORGH_AS_0888]